MALKNFTVPVAFSPGRLPRGPPAAATTASAEAAATPAAKAATITTPVTKAAAIFTRSALAHRNDFAFKLELGCRHATAAIHHGEGHILTIAQAAQASLLNGRDMHEDIGRAIFRADKAEALLTVEEFDLALAFADNLRGHLRTSAATTAAEATAATAPAEPVSAAAAEAITASAAATETITAAAEATAATATEAVSAEAAATAAVAVIAKIVEFVPATSAAIPAAPSIKTHALSNFPKISSPDFDVQTSCTGRVASSMSAHSFSTDSTV